MMFSPLHERGSHWKTLTKVSLSKQELRFWINWKVGREVPAQRFAGAHEKRAVPGGDAGRHGKSWTSLSLFDDAVTDSAPEIVGTDYFLSFVLVERFLVKFTSLQFDDGKQEERKGKRWRCWMLCNVAQLLSDEQKPWGKRCSTQNPLIFSSALGETASLSVIA